MKAAVAVGGDLVIKTVDDPIPQPGEVLVASIANGICGSDLQALELTRDVGLPESGPFIIPGHEFCAQVIDYGPAVDTETKARFPRGTLVCANPFLGGWDLVGATPRWPGGLGELMVLPKDRLLSVPADLDPKHAALAEPLAVGIRAVAAARRGSNRGPYVVIGCGPIGLAVIVALRASGLGPIIAADLSPNRRALAESLGADVVVAADVSSPFEQLAVRGFQESPTSPLLDSFADGPFGPTVFECVGKPGLIQSIIEGTPRHTHLVVVGICRQPDTFVPVNAVVKEISVDFVLAYRPREFVESLRRITESVVDVAPLITATVDLDDAQWAVDALRRGEHGKILVLPRSENSA
jgi:threonine dehydrogenase-like Zn-dependent dehydrogenase